MDDDEWGDDRPPGARKRNAADPDEAAKADALAPALKAEIEACVARLGADDAAGRRKARTRLQEFATDAHPPLRK